MRNPQMPRVGNSKPKLLHVLTVQPPLSATTYTYIPSGTDACENTLTFFARDSTSCQVSTSTVTGSLFVGRY